METAAPEDPPLRCDHCQATIGAAVLCQMVVRGYAARQAPLRYHPACFSTLVQGDPPAEANALRGTAEPLPTEAP